MRLLQAHSHLGLGTLHSKTGHQEQAHAKLSAAIDLYCNMDMMFWLTRCRRWPGRTALITGDHWLIHKHMNLSHLRGIAAPDRYRRLIQRGT